MPISVSPFRWQNLLPLLPIYTIVVAVNGYVFGAGDQVEVLPYALFLGNSNLYPADFYVQYISQAIPNERYFFSSALALAGAALPWCCGFLHLLCTWSLFAGIYRISATFIQTEGLRWGLLLLLFLPPFYGINLGGNELYYNTFIPSLLAKSLGIWALFHFLNRAYWWGVFFLGLCTFFHPVAGSQLFLILGGVLLWEKITKINPISWTTIAGLVLSFMATAGAWVLFLKLNFDQGTIATDLLFEIMEFRVSHHYFPSYFPLRNSIILLPLFVFAWYYFRKKEKRLSMFFILALLGCGIYTLAVEVLESATLLTTQWFKSTIWLKALAFMAILAWLEERIYFLREKWFGQFARLGLVLLFFIAVLGISFPFSIFVHKPYDFFWSQRISPIVDIALQARENTPEDAVFVIPLSETAFKFHSQRSCYIDYKTVVHRKDAFPIWYQRIQEVYEISLSDKRAGKNITALANDHFVDKTKKEWLELSAEKFQFLLTPSPHQLDFPIVASNNDYKIYRIR